MPSWLIDRLPRRFRTRRGFTILLTAIAFAVSLGYGVFVETLGPIPALFDAVLSALFVFLVFSYVSRNMPGFEPGSRDR